MPHPSVDLGAMPHYERRIEDIKDLLASIEEHGEYHIGETKRLKCELTDLERCDPLETNSV